MFSKFISVAFIFSVFIFILGCSYQDSSKLSSDFSTKITHRNILHEEGNTIQERFSPPIGFKRVVIDSNSFGHDLRNIKLKPHNAPAIYYDGREKSNSPKVYCAVFEQEIGKKDLHQCADAIIRTKAEYHWKRKEYDQIHFNFTNGFSASYKKWAEGYRIKVSGNICSWYKSTEPSYSYGVFWKYLERVFTFAGTLSLSREMRTVSIDDMKVGDVFILGGSPGHAVLVVDMAINPINEKKLFMLAQSYMPAQQMHVLVNSNSSTISPWYELDSSNEVIETPQWTFNSSDLKRFP